MKPKIVGNLKKGLIFIISAPAGTGKTTLVNLLKNEFSNVVRSISFTTRKPRPNERDGQDYFFISEDEFKNKIKQKDFLEWAEVFGEYYGTSRSHVEKLQMEGKHVALVIDTQGAEKLRKMIDACSIFLFPPNMHELQYRLHSRKSESEEMIQKRLSWAKKEMEKAKGYDYYIINDDLDVAYQVLKSILISEEHKVRGKTIPFLEKITNGQT
ncbi:MAG: guanylate kinase [Chlamydiae bacterium CG10_big_fil_rev_8_21_14_0_10_35_9]|nr:MAG: guanylate kinase [Chlamydiae bacterium CG10_big_fil_rev_8_21_14_0_10_35_9]